MTTEVITADRTDAFACPNCRYFSLNGRENSWHCPDCNSVFQSDEGVPVFRNHPASFHWGVSQQQIIDMLDKVPEQGWHDAMLQLCSDLSEKEAQILWSRALGLPRLAMSMVLDLNKDSRILDFGSGFGSISLHLAQRCAQVTAMDQIPLHLKWLKAMAQDQGVDSIRYVQAGDTQFLPFRDGEFDAVILNGVLEHVATNNTGEPRSVQTHYLKEVRRILKPAGQVYIGIENRINYKYFMGVREGHIQMKYGALLPRFLTRLYLKLARNRPFREYTYTLWGYRKLLKEAGFNHTRFFAPWPTYSSATRFFPVIETADTDVWKVSSSHPAAKPPGVYFTRAYSMTASVERPQPALIQRILNDLAKQSGQELPWQLNHCVFYPTSGGKAFLDAQTPDNRRWRIQVGITDYAGYRIRCQYAAVDELKTRLKGDAWKQLLPSTVYTGEQNGYFYGMRSFTPGVSGGDLIRHSHTREPLLTEAQKALENLYDRLGERTTVDESVLNEHFLNPLNDLRSWFTSEEWKEHGKWFEQTGEWLRSQVLGKSLLLVPFHGDYVPTNCIWDDQKQELAQVLDWELYLSKGLPVIDWACFLGDAYRDPIMELMRQNGQEPEAMRFHGHPFIFINGLCAEKMDAHMSRIGLDTSLKQPLLLMWWVRQLVDWKPLHQYNPQWRRTRVFEMLERWNGVWRGDDRQV